MHPPILKDQSQEEQNRHQLGRTRASGQRLLRRLHGKDWMHTLIKYWRDHCKGVARLNLFEEILHQECKVCIITTRKTTAPRQKERHRYAYFLEGVLDLGNCSGVRLHQGKISSVIYHSCFQGSTAALALQGSSYRACRVSHWGLVLLMIWP